jgi:hypothetical protein
MSHYRVRQIFEAELKALTAIATYIETINKKAQPPVRGLWMAAEFYASFDDPICYSGTSRVESGEVDVIVYGDPGNGYDAVGKAAADIIDHFKNWSKDSVEVTDVLGGQDEGSGDAEGLHYGQRLTLFYNYYY